MKHYAEGFGPFVMARRVLEPQGRWSELLDAFGKLVERFNVGADGTARIPSSCLIITIDR